MYQPRTYRHWIKDKDLVSFNVTVKETDLYLRAQRNLEEEAHKAILKYRTPLEKYIELHPLFLTTLEPFPVAEDAPKMVREMAEAAEKAGVGPMAAVAGAIAEGVGRELMKFSEEVIVENGGDIFLKTLKKRLVGVYAGESPFTGKIALQIQPEQTPLGICTSSGTVGPSLSFGSADAVIVLSPSTALADAAATAIGNLVKESSDIPKGIEFARGIAGLKGVLIIKEDKLGVWGEVKIFTPEER
ncbi:MAG: UPF0280 family protein [Dehalococcoidia bacterium]|nr:UPF0280 family protein [Dehalococcoidia bacterium]